VIGTPEAILCGCGGALAAEVLGLFSFRKYTFATLPPFLRDPWYYFVGFLGIAAAAFVTYLYASSAEKGLSPLLAANVGATWPLILRVSAERIPTDIGGPVNDA